MQPSRIIITGKNRNFPKIVRMPVGFGVDGAEITASVHLSANECKCTSCGGWGELRQSTINPSERDTYTRCPDCDGEGIAKVAA